MYALDSNSVIHLFKGRGNVTRHFLETPPREIAIPAIALHELETGIAKSSSPEKRRAQLDDLMALLTVLPFGAPEARASARIRAALETRGTTIGPLDILIAGTALSCGATLVTHNTDEFGRVPGLSIVDWY
jgi:tRNA(fMet)-specific endonuclease VapC